MNRDFSALFVLLALAVGCSGDDEPSCDEIEQEVYDLIEVNQSCTMNADCVGGASLECFTDCGYLVNRNAREDVRARGQNLVDEYKGRGCACFMASCAEEEPSHFECVNHVCTSVPSKL